MGNSIEKYEASESGRGDRRPRVRRLGFTAALGSAAWLVWILVATLIYHHSGRIAANLGCHPDVVVGALLTLALLLLLLSGLWREPPRQGPPFLDRWLVVVMLSTGLGAFDSYMGPNGRDRWSMSGPVTLSAFLIGGLLCLLRWLDRKYPGGLAEIWRLALRGDPGMKPKEKVGADDLGLD